MSDPTDLDTYTLLHLIRCADCRAPMTPTTYRGTRYYQCIGTCRDRIDALHAETLMWDRAATRHPRQVVRNTPVAQRQAVLSTVLSQIHARGPSWALSLRAAWTERQSSATRPL